MKDKVCLVTGATSGIGKVTALELSKTGATVVIVGRNKQKTEETLKEIVSQSKNEKVSYLLGDLSLQKDIRRIAEEFKSKHDKLDILVNNAGLMKDKKEVTSENIEYTFATNHLGYFLLTNLLLELLKKSSPARIINVASDAHKMGDIDFSDVNFEKHKYSPWKAYGKSKLDNILFTYELAERLKGTGVTVNCLHPGVINTGFLNAFTMPVIGTLIKSLGKFFLLTPEQGAETQIYLAMSPDVEGVTGKYFDKKKAVSSSSISYNKKAQKELWELSEKMTSI